MKNIIITIGILFVLTALIGCISQKGVTSSEKQMSDKTNDVTPLKGKGVKVMRPEVTGTWDDLLWQRCIEFQRDDWVGLAIGFRVAEAVIEKLHLKGNERIVCVTETDTWPSDAIQVVLGSTFGMGQMIYHNTGKSVFNFFNLKTGEKVRICCKSFGKNKDSGKEQTEKKQTKEEAKAEARLNQEYILKAPLDELFDFKEPTVQASELALILAGRKDRKEAEKITCEICGELTPAYSIQVQDGKKVCPDCFKGKW